MTQGVFDKLKLKLKKYESILIELQVLNYLSIEQIKLLSYLITFIINSLNSLIVMNST